MEVRVSIMKSSRGLRAGLVSFREDLWMNVERGESSHPCSQLCISRLLTTLAIFSNAGSSTFQILPFPRISSSSSLMSLDDTPIKTNSPSLRRRLASKSMHDLHGQSGTITTPTRTVSISNDALRAVANRSPVTIAPPILSRPPSAPVPEQPSLLPQPAPHSRAYSNPNSPSLMPPLPHSVSAPSTVNPSNQHILYDDDMPSPFLKKPQSIAMNGNRQNSTGGLPKKQPILSRLLASRAQQQQQGDGSSSGRGEGIPRRISAARKSLGV